MRTSTKVGRLVGVALVAMAATACRQDMHDQPNYQPLEASTFFGDSQASRQLVPGTVAVGHLNDDDLLRTGKVDGADATMFPFAVTEEVMTRGQQRYDIYCSPCHAQTGLGDGMIVQRGFKRPPSYAEPRLREAAPGYIFDVITNGFGSMPDYAMQIKAEDRWAIVAYVRALQLAAHASVNDVAPADRPRLDEVRPAAGAESERH